MRNNPEDKEVATLSRTWLLLIAVLLAALPAAAQTELSLADATRIAREESHRLEAARQAVEIAAGAERIARAEALPELSAMAAWADYDGDVWFARFVNTAQPGTLDPNAPPTDAGDFSTTRLGVLKLTQPLYTGGAVGAKRRAGDLERQLAEQELRQQELELVSEVGEAYYNVLLAERAEEVARESVRRTEEMLQTVHRRRTAEEALAVEVLGVESQLAADRHRLLAAVNDVRFARLALNRLLSGDPSTLFQLTDTLDGPAMELDEDDAVRQALSGQPAIEQAKLRRSLAGEMEAAARSHFKPKLALEAYYSWIDSETLFEGTHFGAALNVSIPFVKDFSAGAADLSRSAARREMEQSSLDELTSAVELRTREAVRRVTEAHSSVDVARTFLAYQEEKHRVTASAFREQLATADDLMGEQVALSAAELEVLRALHQARLREAELEEILAR